MEKLGENDEEMYEKYVKILSDEKLLHSHVTEYKRQDVDLCELGYLVNHLEAFSSTFPDTFSKSHVIQKLCELIVGFGLVRKFEEGEDRDYDARDFPRTAENAIKCFKYLTDLLKEVKQLDISRKRQVYIPALLLCATHSKKFPWSSEESVAAYKNFLRSLLICAERRDVPSLLCDEKFHPSIFKGVLKVMRSSLLKDTWMKNPSSCHLFYWFLRHVKHPHLADYISDVFPPPFMFVSHFAIPQEVLGIQCFDHILENVPPTLLVMDGKQDAIYHSLSPLLYSKELPIVTVLYPCLLKLPMMTTQKHKLEYWVQYDHVVHHLLSTVELECSIQLKRILLTHLHSYIEQVPPFKHLKRILIILERNLSMCDGPEELCRIISLKIIRTVIKLCWPRMENYCYEILNIILKLINDLEEHEESLAGGATEEIYLLCEHCVYLLKHSCQSKFDALASEYVEGNSNLPGMELLKAVMVKED